MLKMQMTIARPQPIVAAGKHIIKDTKVEVVTPLLKNDLYHMVDIVISGAESDKFCRLKTLGYGNFSVVKEYRQYAIKYITNMDELDDIGDTEIQKGTIKDAIILKRLKNIKGLPKLYAIIDNKAMIVEQIDGITFESYYEEILYGSCYLGYISKNFYDEFVEILRNIIEIGNHIPLDIHTDNVMVDRNTGKPVIIDVGLFKPCKRPEKYNFDYIRDDYRITSLLKEYEFKLEKIFKYQIGRVSNG